MGDVEAEIERVCSRRKSGLQIGYAGRLAEFGESAWWLQTGFHWG